MEEVASESGLKGRRGRHGGTAWAEAWTEKGRSGQREGPAQLAPRGTRVAAVVWGRGGGSSRMPAPCSGV